MNSSNQDSEVVAYALLVAYTQLVAYAPLPPLDTHT